MKEEDKSQKREPEDVLFRYRSYGKSELASLYLPDILPGSPILGHDKNILLLQNTCSRQIIGDLNGHGFPPG